MYNSLNKTNQNFRNTRELVKEKHSMYILINKAKAYI